MHRRTHTHTRTHTIMRTDKHKHTEVHINQAHASQQLEIQSIWIKYVEELKMCYLTGYIQGASQKGIFQEIQQ